MMKKSAETAAFCRKRIRIYGIVQGVGFRPFVYRIAKREHITGEVRNRGAFVEIKAEGTKEALQSFLCALEAESPEKAQISHIVQDALDLKKDQRAGETGRSFKNFRISNSRADGGDYLIPPDLGICTDCARELTDPANRRYRHPFINCTQCGPRFTIMEGLPYDRERTSMKSFSMCPDCQREYTDPRDRRFDAQPVCCPDCGPSYFLLSTNRRNSSETDEAGEPDEAGRLDNLHLEPMNPNTGDWRNVKKQLAENKQAQSVGREQEAIGNARNARVEQEASGQAQSVGREQEAIGNARNSREEWEAIRQAKNVLRQGGILAVKGIGGFHLCCNAEDEDAVRRLRQRKGRKRKPFAVMMRDIDTVEQYCEISEAEKALLTGAEKPIVILNRKERNVPEVPDKAERKATGVPDREERNLAADPDRKERNLAADSDREEQKSKRRPLAVSIAPENPTLGVMLPYAPIHLLLFSKEEGEEDQPDTIVMTSGNRSGAPIAATDEEAIEQLREIADLILTHNRPIITRADDSVVRLWKGQRIFIRRSRGYAPLPIRYGTKETSRRSILGIGGDLKNIFTLSRGEFYYPSAYIGDLLDLRSRKILEEGIRRLSALLKVRPEGIACDLHPRYQSVQIAGTLAKQLKIRPVFVQHHYAHILSCMAENGIHESCIGIALDGTGYGTDQTIWGGEILRADENSFQRIGSVVPFLEIGGDRAVREGWRIALSMILELYGQKSGAGAVRDAEDIALELGLCDAKTFQAYEKLYEVKVNAVKSTSAGRIFDAAAALLGLGRSSDYEGEMAQKLMYQAEKYERMTRKKPDEKKGRPDPAGFQQRMSERRVPPQGLLTIENRSEASGYLQENQKPGMPAAERSAEQSPENFFLSIRTDRMIRFLLEEKLEGIREQRDPDKENTFLAWSFHRMLADALCQAALEGAKRTGLQRAVLSGGVFQNELLLQMVMEGLENTPLQVLTHKQLPANDGGLSVGQAVAAQAAYKNFEK